MQTFTLSIVSHGHKSHIEHLFEDLAKLERQDINVILTINLPEELPVNINSLSCPVQIIHNKVPKGFGCNHNAAFSQSTSKYFVVLNPDVRLISDPFSALLNFLKKQPKSICAPVVLNQNGELEDSARFLPTPFFLFKKLVAKVFGFKLKLDKLAETPDAYLPDWVAGMFMVCLHDVYQEIGGFDERYRMYYEDVDLCVRARLSGCDIFVVKAAQVIHEAQRDSHRKINHLKWHVLSAMKFFLSKSYWRLKFLSVSSKV